MVLSHNGAINSIGYSYDGKILGTIDEFGNSFLYDAITGQYIG